MKRLYFFILCLCFSNFLFGQQSPIIGYDKLEFGATIEAFQRLYPTAKEISSNQNSIGVRMFQQRNVGSGITARDFKFFNNKFYYVTVIYDEMNNNNTINALLDRIVEIYGKFDNKEEDTDVSGGAYTEETYLYRRYRNNFYIQFCIFKSFFPNGGIIYQVLISYYNPITTNEVAAAEKKQAGRGLGL